MEDGTHSGDRLKDSVAVMPDCKASTGKKNLDRNSSSCSLICEMGIAWYIPEVPQIVLLISKFVLLRG